MDFDFIPSTMESQLSFKEGTDGMPLTFLRRQFCCCLGNGGGREESRDKAVRAGWVEMGVAWKASVDVVRLIDFSRFKIDFGANTGGIVGEQEDKNSEIKGKKSKMAS